MKKESRTIVATVLINFATFRSAASVTTDTLANRFPQIRTIVVIAEGIPENHTWTMNQLAREKNVVIGIKAGVMRLGNSGGKLENVVTS